MKTRRTSNLKAAAKNASVKEVTSKMELLSQVQQVIPHTTGGSHLMKA
jgi:hypothetical protein